MGASSRSRRRPSATRSSARRSTSCSSWPRWASARSRRSRLRLSRLSSRNFAVFASRNRHKARELEALLPGWTLEPLDRDDYPPETGATYYENAALKVRFGRHHFEGWVLAEDSGLEVEALGRRPGVLSARYAPEGTPAVAKLLGELEGIDDRRARYVSELVLFAPFGRQFRGTGVLAGRIAEEARGSEG